MGPNKNCFFKDPSSHRKTYYPELCHQDALACSKKQLKKSRLIQKLLASEKSAVPLLTVENPAPVQVRQSSNNTHWPKASNIEVQQEDQIPIY